MFGSAGDGQYVWSILDARFDRERYNMPCSVSTPMSSQRSMHAVPATIPDQIIASTPAKRLIIETTKLPDQISLLWTRNQIVREWLTF